MGLLVTDNTTLRYARNSLSGTFTTISLPAAVALTTKPASACALQGKVIIARQPTRPLVFLEDEVVHAAGIQPPSTAPTLATSGTGITGSAIGYFTFDHWIGNRLIHRSDLSKASNTLALTNQGRQWTGVPGLRDTADPSGVTHVSGFVSMDGANPRLAWTRELGSTTTVTENVPTAALGEVAPTDNGVPPQSLMVETYHDRVWYVDAALRDRLWYTELLEGEAVGSVNFLTTRGGEPITGLKRRGDQLVVFTRRVGYDVQGYDEADFSMRKISDIGCISDPGIVAIDETLYFPGEDGVYKYDGGSFEYLSGNVREYWKTDFASNPDGYYSSFAVDERRNHRYKLTVTNTGVTNITFSYVHDYQKGGMRIEFDQRTRQDTALGFGIADDGTYVVLTGSSDGHVRRDDSTNANDDSDTYAKKISIEGRAEMLAQAFGGSLRGAAGKDLTIHMKTTGAWTLNLYGGEEDASSGTAKQTISVASQPTRNNWPFRPVGWYGKALVVRVEQSSPTDISFRGYDVGVVSAPGRKF